MELQQDNVERELLILRPSIFDIINYTF